MLLADLFKPNKYGTEATVTTVSGELVIRTSNCFLISSLTRLVELPLDTKVVPNHQESLYMLEDRTDDYKFICFVVHYLLPATADNILIAKTLERL